ncbi:hypothetical protein KAW08_01365 [bacterium]|nr:hypothetical protein [bacterium]
MIKLLCSKNRFCKGTAMIAALIFLLISAIATSSYLVLVTNEGRMTDQLNDSTRAFYLAEAGVEQAIYQLSQNQYAPDASSIPQTQIASDPQETYTVNMSLNVLPGPDTVSMMSIGNFHGRTRTINVVASLESALPRYMVLVDTANWGSGNGAQYGRDDGVSPRGTPFSPANRMRMYLTGNYAASVNVDIFGDLFAEGNFSSKASSDVHGDAYLGGIFDNGGTIDDGWNIGDGDLPADLHTLQPDQIVEYPILDMTFYAANNDLALAGTKYLDFTDNGTSTTVKEYSDASYTTLLSTSVLPQEGVLYVNGDAHVRGTIKGHVTVVASDDIFFQGDVNYANGTGYSDASDSAAYLASDDLFFLRQNLEVSGIFYTAPGGRFTSSSGDANKNRLRIYGNRIMASQSNMSPYSDRAYLYDANIYNFPPPGLPVRPIIQSWTDLGK